MSEREFSDELLLEMLHRRASSAPPTWLLHGITEGVRATDQVSLQTAAFDRLLGWRGGRLALVAAAALLLLLVAGGVLVAARLLLPPPAPTLPAVVVAPTASPSPSPAPSRPTTAAAPSVRPRQTAAAEPSEFEAWSLPAGWHHDLVCEDGTPCQLHLYDGAGIERQGWPVALQGDCSGGFAIGPDRTVFVACTERDAVAISGLDDRGHALSGWPVRHPGQVAYSTWNDFGFGVETPSVRVGPDGVVLVAVAPDDRGRRYALEAFAADASPRRGWPVALPGSRQGFTLTSTGNVLAWWYEGVEEAPDLEARRTVLTTIDPAGRTLKGWPIGSTGAASGPVAGAAGRVFYVSATGKVWGHDEAGKVSEEWPYQLPEPVAPTLRPDGLLQFIGGSEVTVVDQRGRLAPGWPYQARGTLSGPACDTPSFPYQPSAMTANNRLYLAEWDGKRTTVLALDRKGRSPGAWPYRVTAGWRATSVEVGEHGTVTVGLTGDLCGFGPDDTAIRLSRDGELLGDGPGMPLREVYEALRIGEVLVSNGGAPVPQGDPVAISTGLVNRSLFPVTLPRVTYVNDDFYVAGELQAWIERLGPHSRIDCLPNVGRKGTWYRDIGWVLATQARTRLPRGSMLTPLFHGGLSSELTRCLPPGIYRYHVEYLPWDGPVDDVIDSTWTDVTIVAALPAASPMSTPIAPPRPVPAPTTPAPQTPAPSPAP